MLIVAVAFIVVFLFRDVLVLAAHERAIPLRFAAYALLIVAAVALMARSAETGHPVLYSWMRRDFAIVAVVVQMIELAVAIALRKFALGRYSWIGCILPAPAFLVVLFALSLAIQDRFLALDAGAVLKIVTAVWLSLVGGSVTALCWLDNPWEDRKFAGDFALMTSCTALIFVPLVWYESSFR